MKKEDRLQLITIHQDLLIILIENFLRPKENLLLFFFLKKKEKMRTKRNAFITNLIENLRDKKN